MKNKLPKRDTMRLIFVYYSSEYRARAAAWSAIITCGSFTPFSSQHGPHRGTEFDTRHCAGRNPLLAMLSTLWSLHKQWTRSDQLWFALSSITSAVLRLNASGCVVDDASKGLCYLKEQFCTFFNNHHNLSLFANLWIWAACSAISSKTEHHGVLRNCCPQITCTQRWRYSVASVILSGYFHPKSQMNFYCGNNFRET